MASSKCPYCESTRGIEYEVVQKVNEWLTRQWRCKSCRKLIGVEGAPSKRLSRKLRKL